MEKCYTVIVPKLDGTGPTNLALDLAQEAKAAGWDVRVLYLSKEKLSSELVSAFEARRFTASDIFSLRGIIHSHGITADLWASLIPHTTKRWVYSTLHGQYPQHLYFEHGRFVSRVAWFIWRLALLRFQGVFCISRTMKSFYEARYPRMRLHVAFNMTSGSQVQQGILSEELHSWVARQRDFGRAVLIFAGSLTARKNIAALVAHVQGSDGLSLIVCGDGPLFCDLALSQSSSNYSGGNVFFAGHVSNLSDYFCLSDIFVLPSFAEGLPLVVLEALKEGCPAVLSDIAVHRELCLMGAGDVFDHETFSNFEEVVSRALAARNIQSDEARRHLWAEFFSPQNGFRRYEKIFLSGCSSEVLQ